MVTNMLWLHFWEMGFGENRHAVKFLGIFWGILFFCITEQNSLYVTALRYNISLFWNISLFEIVVFYMMSV